MSKRFIFPQQHGERKKAKLDVTISDHNFPLSQNCGHKQDTDLETWGDENDDEILLLASQACEQAYSNDSLLPDYSICMQPASTSTQISDPGPSTSKAGFTFKKPSSNIPNAISTQLKNKCTTISSPLPGMSSKILSKANEPVKMTDDLIFNDKVYKGQDSDQLYRQLLQLQEENAKLKSENGKLLEKCVTKEGEASILRTQLKTCQVAVDNARLDKIKAQEKVQMEWTEKLSNANGQIHDLRTQLDFKNLEIISIKEKCKKLESTKLKLTQVMVGSNDISNRNNNSIIVQNNTSVQQTKQKVSSSSVQTDNKASFLKLNNSCKLDTSNLTEILPLILETSTEQYYSILGYNEKLQKHTDLSQNKCRIFSTFHRLPSSPNSNKDMKRNKIALQSIYEDITYIAGENKEFEKLVKSYCKILTAAKSVLEEVHSELEEVSKRATTAFQKEMDERYIEASSTYLCIGTYDLLQGRILYKEEQALLARRITALLAFLAETPKCVELLSNIQEANNSNGDVNSPLVGLINRICNLLDTTSCAPLYSGLLLAITLFIKNILKHTEKYENAVVGITKSILTSRPMPFVTCQLLALVRCMSSENILTVLCPGNSAGNLKVDYDQGVLLYKKDSCYLQVLLKQIEVCLRCIERQKLIGPAVEITQNLIALNNNLDSHSCNAEQDKSRCDCKLVLIQVVVYALRICAVMLRCLQLSMTESCSKSDDLISVCRSGIQVLYRCVLRDVEFGSQLGYNEGHLMEFCEILREYDHSEHYGNMLSEITGTFQSTPEETPSSFHREAWLNTFKNFTIAD